jgi:hypothetical protein
VQADDALDLLRVQTGLAHLAEPAGMAPWEECGVSVLTPE